MHSQNPTLKFLTERTDIATHIAIQSPWVAPAANNYLLLKRNLFFSPGPLQSSASPIRGKSWLQEQGGERAAAPQTVMSESESTIAFLRWVPHPSLPHCPRFPRPLPWLQVKTLEKVLVVFIFFIIILAPVKRKAKKSLLMAKNS